MFGLLVNIAIAGVVLTSARQTWHWLSLRQEYAARHRLGIRASRVSGFRASHRLAS